MTEHQTVALRPSTDHVLHPWIGSVSPSQGLAIQGDDFLGNGLTHPLCPAQERVEKLLGIKRGEDPVECIVAGAIVAQAQKRFEPVVFGAAEVLPVVEALTAAKQTAAGADQAVDQVMVLGPVDARVGDGLEVVDETDFGMVGLHPDVQSHRRDSGIKIVHPASR